MAKPVKRTRKEAKPTAEPRLGIFWLVDGKLLIDSAPLSECEQYGDHLNYPGSHIHVWEQWRQVGKAPVGVGVRRISARQGDVRMKTSSPFLPTAAS